MNDMDELTQHHLSYINSKGPFRIDCSLGIFSPEQREMLIEFGHWFHALTNGDLEPITPLQLRFINVMKHEIEPFTIAEWAWLKYISRKEIEAKYGERLCAQYVPAEDSFYSRDMVKQVRKTMYKEMKENHKL